MKYNIICSIFRIRRDLFPLKRKKSRGKISMNKTSILCRSLSAAVIYKGSVKGQLDTDLTCKILG